MKKNPITLYEVQKFQSIKEMLQMAVDAVPEKAAYRYRTPEGIRDVSYAEFQSEIHALGTALYALGVAEEHISIISENRYEWIVVYLTALLSRGVFVPMDKELPLTDLVNVVNHSDSTVLFYSAKYEKDLMAKADEMPNIRYYIGIDRKKSEGKFLSYTELMEKGKALLALGEHGFVDMENEDDRMKMIVYTSGTTGNSKGVMLSEHNLVSSVYYGLQVSTIYETGLSVLPYHHTYEAVAGLLVSLHHHSTLCINENLKVVLKNIQTYQPEYIYLVPAFVEVFYKKIWSQAESTGKAGMLKALIKVSNGLRRIGIDKRRSLFKTIHTTFGGKLKKIVCGGAPIRPELGDFFDAIGINLINGYGITECSPLISANFDAFNDCSTTGFPLPCLEVTLEDVTPEGDGEICVKGDVVMMGYYKNPEQTAEALIDGVFHTGDYGRFDDYGRIIITGRKKNLIVLSNGKNIFPEEIENCIGNIPYVAEVAVFALKNENKMDNALGAEVFLSQEKIEELGIKDPEEEIKADVAKACAHLPAYKQITKVFVRPIEFEKTTTKKIKRTSIIHQ